MRFALRLFLLACLFCASASSETVKDREGAVRGDRAAMESNTRWIYNDWRKGFEEARRTGRPLMVVLRCVPCLACAGIDAGVLTEEDLQPLLNRFVKVRLINANALDLSLFQFDYDLSFSAMFFNADGTVYGRFGSWKHQKNAQDKDTASFRKALQGALAIHQEYPSNKVSLQGKQGVPLPVNDPLQLPELAGKYKRELDWEGKVVQSCVHCHQVSDALRSSYRKAGADIPDKWVYPMPNFDAVGAVLAPDSVATVQSVVPGSIAAKAGLQSNDEILSIDGQPLISTADVSWILHNAAEPAVLALRLKRGSAERAARLELPRGWRGNSDIGRRVGTWPMRAMALGGLLLEELPAEERSRRDIPDGKMALLVKHAGEYGQHAAAKNAGVRKGDVVVAVDGDSAATTESQLIGRLLKKYQPGQKASFTLLREAQRLEISIPMQ